MAETKGMHVRIDADVHRRLKILSAKTGKPMAELVEEAVQDLLKKRGE